MPRLENWSFLLATTLAVASLAAACGGDNGDGATTGGTPGGAGGGGGSAGEGGSLFTTGSGTVNDTLTVSPQDAVLDVDGAPATLQLTATLNDGSTPGNLIWEVDDVVIGTISDGGAFLSGGMVAGVATVTARSGMLTASTTVTVRAHIQQNPGGVSQDDQLILLGGGDADASFRWLYPYDQTVFPRGLRAPELQFGGAPADASYVRVSLPNFTYEGFFGASSPARVALPQDIWRAITRSAGASDPVTVEVTKLSAGQATGPVTETWRIAPGDFKGVVYYNTYVSAQTSTGAVMRVRPNVDAEVFIGGCTVCHSVSANGNVLAGGVNWGNGNPLDSASFDLAADGSSSTRHLADDGRKMSFGGLTPNGEWLLASGVPAAGSPIRGLAGDFPSRLFDTATGEEVPAPTFSSAVTYALTPAFAPDGSRVAFSWYDQGAGQRLAVMDFDGSQSPPVFSNLQEVATASRTIAGWPSFLPDAGAVLFHDGDAFDTAGYGGTPSYAELRLVDVATKTVVNLDALNGRGAAGNIYLPYGDAEEANLSYEPTVLPLAVGGYYWVVFTSRRAYGNTIAPGGTVPGGDNKWGTIVNGGEVPSMRKKLWVAAIDINYAGQADPSHPAFYLGEQELEAGNMRAFVALDPCKPDGSTCESAAECCGGYCRQTGETDENGMPVLACVPPPEGGCSGIDEACTAASDCCQADALCINGRCALPPPR